MKINIPNGADFILAGDFNAGWKPFWCPCLFKDSPFCDESGPFCSKIRAKYPPPSNHEMVVSILLRYNGTMAETTATWKKPITSNGRTLDYLIISCSRTIVDFSLDQELELYDHAVISAIVRLPRRASGA